MCNCYNNVIDQLKGFRLQVPVLPIKLFFIMNKQFESIFIIIIFSTQPTTAIRSWEVSMTSGFLITRTSWWSSTSAITTSAGCQPTYPGPYRLSRRSTPHVTISAPSEWTLSVASSVKGQLILIISLFMMFGFSKVCW